MTIFEYCDALNLDIELTRYENQKGRWSAMFRHCHEKDGIFIRGTYGDGKSPREALINYLRKIENKTLVYMHATPEYRREFKVPNSIEVPAYV